MALQAPQSDKIGIKETRELFKSTGELVEAVRISRADNGKIDFPGDIANFLTPLLNLPTAINGADQIPKELRDLDQLELTQLEAEFGDIVNDARYRKIFYGLLLAGDGILEVISGEEAS